MSVSKCVRRIWYAEWVSMCAWPLPLVWLCNLYSFQFSMVERRLWGSGLFGGTRKLHDVLSDSYSIICLRSMYNFVILIKFISLLNRFFPYPNLGSKIREVICCTDYKAPWHKFVMFGIWLYKGNGLENVTANTNTRHDSSGAEYQHWDLILDKNYQQQLRQNLVYREKPHRTLFCLLAIWRHLGKAWGDPDWCCKTPDSQFEVWHLFYSSWSGFGFQWSACEAPKTF